MANLMQCGTIAGLLSGALDGKMSVGEMRRYGDTGLGTGTGLDGEIVIVDSTAWQVLGNGEVRALPEGFQMPFVNAHFADFTPLFSAEACTQAELEARLLPEFAPGHCYALRLKGDFVQVQARAVIAQQRPYPGLKHAEEIATRFFAEQVRGTAVGYFFPVEMGVPAHFHWHFIDDAHRFGGHLLNFSLQKVAVEGQKFAHLDLL